MSETKDQINPTQNSGTVDPNSTIVEPHKTVSPSLEAKSQVTPETQATPEVKPQTAPSTQTVPDASPKIAFHSAAIGTQTARPKDYFAEQNQQTLTKKQAHSTRIRWLLIFSCGLVGVALVVGGVWFLIARNNEPTIDDKPYEEMSESEQTERNVNIGQEVYEAATKDAQNTDESNEADKATAAEVFQQAANSAQNTTEANVIRVSQMRYLLENGEYTEILEIGRPVCEDTNLDLVTRISCANIMELAADRKGDQALSSYYKNLTSQLIDEKIRLEYPEGGQDEVE